MIPPPVCLTIAGSDPSGGAGIQGDLKTFAAHGVYGMAVISALTAQNTTQVSDVVGLAPQFITAQLSRIFEDIPTNFVKTGMLLNAETIEAVTNFFANRPEVHLIVDPVMISSSGAPLIANEAIATYKSLCELATLVTPNNRETQHLTGIKVTSIDDAISASLELQKSGIRSVLIKGGDAEFRESPDLLFDVLNDQGTIHVFERPLVGARNSHGTGCAMAASICCYLALGYSLPQAVDYGGKFVGGALANAYSTGQGSGSINHLWNTALKSSQNR